MLTILKTNTKQKNNHFLNSPFGKIKLFFIDEIIIVPKKIKIIKKNKIIFFESELGILSLKFIDNINFFIKNNNLLINFNLKTNKKNIINLYNKLIKIKIKGVLQNFKIKLILKGVGFKSLIEGNNLILKLGFSHDIVILIPENIQIINQPGLLIFHSMDYIFLSQFVHYIKNYKKPEPYKGKGFLLKNEIILKKEGKKGKK